MSWWGSIQETCNQFLIFFFTQYILNIVFHYSNFKRSLTLTCCTDGYEQFSPIFTWAHTRLQSIVDCISPAFPGKAEFALYQAVLLKERDHFDCLSLLNLDKILPKCPLSVEWHPECRPHVTHRSVCQLSSELSAWTVPVAGNSLHHSLPLLETQLSILLVYC